MFENSATRQMSSDLAQFVDDIIDYVRHNDELGSETAAGKRRKKQLQLLVHRVCFFYSMKYSREKTNLLQNPRKKKIVCSV